MHLKRQQVPKNWPIPRKGTTYVVRPRSEIDKGIPILVILRDVLKLAQNRKEVKRIVMMRNILLNHKPVLDEAQNTSLFDVITLLPAKENYRVELTSNGKFTLNKITESQSMKKTAKVINKKTLNGNKTQLNLSDGYNFVSTVKCKTNDSLVINLKDRKIEKCLELKEKVHVYVTNGKHAGKKGTINKIDSKTKIAELSSKEGTFNVLIKQLMVVENE
ncbi:KOW motif-containing protein [Candidatus Pacearchaeota archaeon]|nr:KOW motif-containing protein [Candidatus Pacearchaeota archaeon]